MLPIFPTTLPRFKQFSLSPHELRALTPRSSLPAELRQRSGGRGATFDVAWMLTDAQFTELETFYKEDLSYGNGWFLVPTPLSGSMFSVVQFTEEYSSRKVGFNGKEVSATLETPDRMLFIAAEGLAAAAVILQFRNGYDGDQGVLDVGPDTPAPIDGLFAPYVTMYTVPERVILPDGSSEQAVNGSDAPASALAYLPLEEGETYDITAQNNGSYEGACSATVTTSNGRVYVCDLTARVDGVPSTLTVQRTS